MFQIGVKTIFSKSSRTRKIHTIAHQVDSKFDVYFLLHINKNQYFSLNSMLPHLCDINTNNRKGDSIRVITFCGLNVDPKSIGWDPSIHVTIN